MKLYIIGMYENEEKIKLIKENFDCNEHQNKILAKIDGRVFEVANIDEWICDGKTKMFFTLDLKLRNKEYKKLINNRMQSLCFEKYSIDRKLEYLKGKVK